MAPTSLQQGYLGLVKRKGVERRFFVLHDDRLEYYRSEGDALDPQKQASKVEMWLARPRRRARRGRIGDQTATLREVAAGDAKAWTAALLSATGQGGEERAAEGEGPAQELGGEGPGAAPGEAAGAAAAQSPAPGAVVHEGPLEVVKGRSAPLRHGVLTGAQFAYYASRDEYLQGAAPRGRAPLVDVTSLRCSTRSGLMAMTVKDYDKVLSFRPRGGNSELEVWASKWKDALALWSGAPMVEQSDDEGHDDPRLKEGTFLVNRSGQVQSRHFVLYSDRMVSWSSKACCDGRDAPTYEFSLSEVDDIEILDNGLDVYLRGTTEPLTLLGPAGQELDAWAEAISRVLEGHGPGEPHGARPVALEPSRPWNALDGPGAAPSSAPQPSVSSGAAATKLFKEGLLGFAEGSGLVWKYCVLEQDHLSAWSDVGAAAARKSPDLVLDISAGGAFRAAGAGFVVTCGKGKVGVHVGADGDLPGWSQALSQAFSAHAFDAESSDKVSAWRPPSRHSHAGPPAPSVGLASGGPSGAAGSSRAAGRQRSRSAEPGGRGTPGWLPACALRAPARRPTLGQVELWADVERRAPKLRRDSSREAPRSMVIQSHGAGADAAVLLHGAAAKFHSGSTPSSGPMRRAAEVDGKSAVQTRDSSAPLLGRSPQTLPGKVTDSGFSTARCLPARAEVGSAAHGWSKISGENRAITTASLVVQGQQPCAPKVTAAGRASPSPPPSGRDRRAVSGKITGASSASPPSGRGAHAIAGKITDASRSGLRGWAARTPAAAVIKCH
ncbi:unnamed protein product [Prorocentrum cordatum]|uniref:PH domain-containing protein n=1 Tax=Prorocentrum cordatum TaxID=2364126 RepID=A0ABN9QIM4_9DINO|nr:unnamed protein product [Polarella glacialis]